MQSKHQKSKIIIIIIIIYSKCTQSIYNTWVGKNSGITFDKKLTYWKLVVMECKCIFEKQINEEKVKNIRIPPEIFH